MEAGRYGQVRDLTASVKVPLGAVLQPVQRTWGGAVEIALASLAYTIMGMDRNGGHFTTAPTPTSGKLPGQERAAWDPQD